MGVSVSNKTDEMEDGSQVECFRIAVTPVTAGSILNAGAVFVRFLGIFAFWGYSWPKPREAESSEAQIPKIPFPLKEWEGFRLNNVPAQPINQKAQPINLPAQPINQKAQPIKFLSNDNKSKNEEEAPAKLPFGEAQMLKADLPRFQFLGLKIIFVRLGLF